MYHKIVKNTTEIINTYKAAQFSLIKLTLSYQKLSFFDTDIGRHIPLSCSTDTTAILFLPSHTSSQPPLTLAAPPQEHTESQVWLTTTPYHRPVTKSPAPITAAFLLASKPLLVLLSNSPGPQTGVSISPPRSTGQTALPTLSFSQEPRFQLQYHQSVQPTHQPPGAQHAASPTPKVREASPLHDTGLLSLGKPRSGLSPPGRPPTPPQSLRPAAAALTTWG